MNEDWLSTIQDAVSNVAGSAGSSVAQSAGDWLSSEANHLLNPPAPAAVNSNPTALQIAAGQTGQAQQAVLHPSGAPGWLKGANGKISILVPAIAVIAAIYLFKRGK